MRFDYKSISNIEIDGVNTRDYPDFVDAHISSADYAGRPMTDDELDALNDDTDFVHEKVMEWLF